MNIGPWTKFYTTTKNRSHQLIHYVACAYTSQATSDKYLWSHITTHRKWYITTWRRSTEFYTRNYILGQHQWNRSQSVHKLCPDTHLQLKTTHRYQKYMHTPQQGSRPTPSWEAQNPASPVQWPNTEASPSRRRAPPRFPDGASFCSHQACGSLFLQKIWSCRLSPWT